MPALPVIEDVYRVSLNWSQVSGCTPVNVMNFFAASTDPVSLGESLGGTFSSAMFGCMHSSFNLDSLAVLPLDGATATVVVPVSGVTGGGSGDTVIPAAGLVSLRTAHRGPSGRGRVYLGPVSEGVSGGGALESSVVTSMQTAWNTFRTDLATADVPSTLVVASYVHAVANSLVSCTVETLMGTQRRRQQQLR